MNETYQLYGLTVSSEIQLPEALPIPSVQAPDVTVLLEPVSMDASRHERCVMAQPDNWFCVVSPDHFLFQNLRFIFEIQKGRRISVEITGPGPYDLGKLRTFLLGTAFGVLNIQRGQTPLHGAAFRYGDSAVVLCGGTGAGKSTLLDALIRQGYAFLADDVALTVPEEGTPYLYPAYPQRKLMRDAALRQGCGPNQYPLVNEDCRDKYLIRESAPWCRQKLPLGLLIEILPQAPLSQEGPFQNSLPEPLSKIPPRENPSGKRHAPNLQGIQGIPALQLLIRNLYRRQFYPHMDAQPLRMKQWLTITKNIKAYQLICPHDGNPASCVELIVAACQKDLGLPPLGDKPPGKQGVTLPPAITD